MHYSVIIVHVCTVYQLFTQLIMRDGGGGHGPVHLNTVITSLIGWRSRAHVLI